MKVPGQFYLALISTVFLGWRTQDVSANSVSSYVNAGLLTFNFIIVTSSFSTGLPQNLTLPQDDIPQKNSSNTEKRIRSSLRRRVVRQFGFIAPALQTMGCLPKLFCGLNAKEPDSGTSTINDLSYLMKFAFSDQLDDELDDEDDGKKGKDGHKDEEEDVSEETLRRQKIQEQILEDQAHEDLVYDDPQYLSFIWKDMMEKEEKMKEELKRKNKKKVKGKKKRKPKSLELELDILLKTFEIDKNFNKFSNHFQKFRDIFRSSRQSRSHKIIDDPNFNATEYIETKNRELTEMTDPEKKLEVAVEAGGKLRSGRQCRLLFSTCPYTVDQMKEMIKISNKTQNQIPPEVKDAYNKVPSLKNRPIPLHITDPMQTYMTDDVYVANLDSEHQLEIHREELDKLTHKEKKRPEISITVAPTTVYDADAQLLYLMLPESQIELQQKYEAEMEAAAKPTKTKIKSTEDDEASDQIIPQIQVDYTKPSDEKDDEENDKSSEEAGASKSKESEEMATDLSPENFGLIPLENNKQKVPVISKEEHHDDEKSVVKDENKYMTTTKRPKFKYRIRNKNKNKETDDEESSASEQDDASEEQQDQYQAKNKAKLKKGSSNTNTHTPMPPVFGEIKDTTESSSDSSYTSTSQKTTTEEYEFSDEGPSILPSKYRRPYPYRGNRYPSQEQIAAQDDEKEAPKEPQKIPLGPIPYISDNRPDSPVKYSVPPMPAPPPIYSKLPNSHLKHPEYRPQPLAASLPPPNYNKLSNFLNTRPQQRPQPLSAPGSPPNYNKLQNSHNQRPGQRPKPIKKTPSASSILNSILNFKIVAPKKRPTRRPRPGQRPQSSRPQRPQTAQRPQSSRPQRPRPQSTNNNNKDTRKEPFRPMSLLSLGGIKNVFGRPIKNEKRPLYPPPQVYNGYQQNQNSRPPPPANSQPPAMENQFNDDVSSEENESNGNEAEKSEQPPLVFDLGQLEQLGHKPADKEEPPSENVPPPPIFGMVKQKPSDALLINVDFATPNNSNEEDEEDVPENNATSLEKEDSGSTEEDKSEEETVQKSPPPLRLPNIGSDNYSKDKENKPPPPPPIYTYWKPQNSGKNPQSNNNNQDSHSSRPLVVTQSQLPYGLNNNNNIKDSVETENSGEEYEKSSEENVAEDKPVEARNPRPKPVIEMGSSIEPELFDHKPFGTAGQSHNKNEKQKTKDTGEKNDASGEDNKNEGSEEDNEKQKSKEDDTIQSTEDDGNAKSEEKDKQNEDETIKSTEDDENVKSEEKDDEKSAEDDGNAKSEEKDKQNEDETIKSTEDAENIKSEEKDDDKSNEGDENVKSEEKDKQNEDETIKSTEDAENTKSEEKDNEKSAENDHKSEEQISAEGSSEEKDDGKETISNPTPTTPKPTKVPAIEIVSLGSSETSKESSVEKPVPPPPPVKLWSPSEGNLANDLESSSVEKLPVAFSNKPPPSLPNKPQPPTNPPRPIQTVRSTPSPQQVASSGAMGMGSGMGDGGMGNRGQGNRNKNNRNKKKNNQKENEKDKSSEEKDSEEGDSDEDDDGEENDSPETSSEEVQNDNPGKRTKEIPGRRVVQKFHFPNIGSPTRNTEPVKPPPPQMAIALPPIFKWRSRSGQVAPKNAENQRKGNDANESENGHQVKVYKLSLSSEESSKSSSASLESTKGESSRDEVRGMESELNHSKDEGSEEQIAKANNHNSQSQEIDSRRLEYLPRSRGGGGESTAIMISNKNRGFSSQPHSKKSQRGESQHRKAAPPLPPIFGKVGR